MNHFLRLQRHRLCLTAILLLIVLQGPRTQLAETTQSVVGRYLRAYQRVTLNPATVERAVQATGRFSIATQEMEFDLLLEPHDLRSSHYVAEEVSEDGVSRPIQFEAPKTYKGSVRQIEGSIARFTINSNSVEGIVIGPQDWYLVEPLRHLDPKSNDFEYVVYRAADVISNSVRRCGNALINRLEAGMNHSSVELNGAGVGPNSLAQYTAEVATEADYEFVAALGGSATALSEILSILNQVDGVYQAELSIGLQVSYQHSWATSLDPFNATGASQLLDEFQRYWTANIAGANAFDLAHLWTGRNLAGETIGIAFRGGVCKDRPTSYGLSERSSVAGERVGVPAHEIGHNFGATHPDEAVPQIASCANTIMTSTSFGASLSFCQFSRTEIANHLASYSSCLKAQGASPDLTITSLSAPRAAPLGSTIDVTLRLANQGSAPAASVSVSYFLSPDSILTTADRNIGSCNLTNVVPGAQAQCLSAVILPSNIAIGTYYFGGIVDAEGIVGESSRDNNSSFANTGPLLLTQVGTQPITEDLKLDDGLAEIVLRSDGHIDVNRFTPSSYPATLRSIRVFFAPVFSVASPVGEQIRLHAFTGPSGSSAPSNLQSVFERAFSIPDAAAGPGFVDFDLTNGPTITSGDFYVGYQSPASNVLTFFDTSGTLMLRTFYSASNGQTWLPTTLSGGQTANLMVRAVVTMTPPATCSYSLSPQTQSFPAGGGSGSVSVSTGSACSWVASSNSPWIAMTSGGSGTGNGTVNFTVAANTTASARSAILTVAGQSVQLNQNGVSAQTSSLFIPIVLSAAGLNNSFFTSEMTLTNRGSLPATLQFSYVAAFGDGGGTTSSDLLAAGAQTIIPNVIEYLRQHGLSIPTAGNHGGTLRLRVSGVSSPSDVGVTVRTTTAVEGGQAGLAYPGIPIPSALSGTVYLTGLRQNATDRSNVALQNAGADSDGNVTLRVTVFSGDVSNPQSLVLSDEVLAPGGFTQISGILGSNGLNLTNGFVRVERIAGIAPYYAYAVINDQANSDGSFVPPLPENLMVGKTKLSLPVVVEASPFTTELVFTNWSSSPKTVLCRYVAAAIQNSDSTASFSVTVGSGQQRIEPSIVQSLRNSQTPGIGPKGPVFAGALFVEASAGDLSGVAVSARTSAPGGGGSYGLFYSAVPNGLTSTASAWVLGLQQNAQSRTNLALVNTGETDSSSIALAVDLYDGNTSQKSSSLEITLRPGEWTQIGAILATHAPEVTNGYVRISRISGNNPFVAYGVINDGSQPGQRTGDGAFVSSSP